jgi:hypothetical protein
MGFEQAPDKSFRPRPDLGPAAPGGGRQTELATRGRRSGSGYRDDIPGWDLEQIDRMHGTAKHEGK